MKLLWSCLPTLLLITACSGPFQLEPDSGTDARTICYDGVWYPTWECSDGCTLDGVPLQSTFQSMNRLEIHGQEAVLHPSDPSDAEIIGSRNLNPCYIDWDFPSIDKVSNYGPIDWPDHCITYYGDLGPSNLSQTWCLKAP